MKKQHITAEDKKVAIILKDLHKQNPHNEVCQLNNEGIRLRAKVIADEILLENMKNEIQTLKLIKVFKENQITIQNMITTTNNPLTIQILNEEIIRIDKLINKLIQIQY